MSGALVRMKWKGKKNAELQGKEEGILGAGRSGISRSLLDDQKAVKEEEVRGFISC